MTQMKYVVRMNNTYMDKFETYEEADKYVEEMIETDEEDGEENFYSIRKEA